MRSRWLALLVGGGLLVLAGVCFADLSAGERMAARDLIKQLSSEQFKLREQAVERLAAMGPDVVALIKPLLESKDEELKLRAEMILKRIGEQHPDAPGLPEAVGAFDRERGSLITLKLVNADLATVLARIAQQTGNQMLNLPEDWKGEPVSVDFNKTPYWEAVDQLCKMQGLIYEQDWRSQSLRLVSVEKSREITSYAGPVVFKVTSAVKNRSYRSSRSNERLTYTVYSFWEDRLKPSWHEPAEVQKVTDQTGAEIGVDDANDRSRRTMRGWFGRSGPERAMPGTAFMVTMPDYPDKLTGLKDLSGQLTLAFAKGTQEITIEDVLGGGEKSGAAGACKLTVREPNRQRQFVTLKGTLTRDGKPVEWLNYGGDQRYGVWLVDLADKRYRGYIGFGGLNVRNLGAGRAGQAEVRVQVDQGAGAGGAVVVGGQPGQAQVQVVIGGDEGEGPTVRMMFQGLPEEMDVFRLVYVFPAEVETKVYPFKFTEVPVP